MVYGIKPKATCQSCGGPVMGPFICCHSCYLKWLKGRGL